MSLRDEDLRAAYRASAPPVGACPDSAVLVRAAEGTLGDEEREAVIAHLETCARCAEDVKIAFAALGPVRSARGRSTLLPSRPWLAAAAVALLGVGAAVVLLRARPVSEPAGERGVAVSAPRTDPPDGAVLAEAPTMLAWAGARPAEEYAFALYDAESRLLWQGTPAKDPRAALPADVRARLEGGRRYLWRVKATRGFETQESPVFVFTLKAR
jgi:hypothetical protein